MIKVFCDGCGKEIEPGEQYILVETKNQTMLDVSFGKPDPKNECIVKNLTTPITHTHFHLEPISCWKALMDFDQALGSQLHKRSK